VRPCEKVKTVIKVEGSHGDTEGSQGGEKGSIGTLALGRVKELRPTEPSPLPPPPEKEKKQNTRTRKAGKQNCKGC